ncbi:MAG: helix-turn-helix domain-containing protein [Alphaproteobacteria bacterium]
MEQIRAARALIGWSQGELAEQASLSQTGIARIENGTNQPNSQTLEKIKNAFDQADVEFIGNTGVKKRVGEVRTLKGTNGFRVFMDDVYETAKTQGGQICLYNAKPENWHRWLGQEWYQAHSERMKEIKNGFEFIVSVNEGEDLFIGQDFVEYRWFPEELFNEQSFYAYGNKLAFLNFSDNNVVITILENKDFADGFRALFSIAWKYVSVKP